MEMNAEHKNPKQAAEVSFYEKRKKIHAKRVRGFFDNWRIALVIITQLIFYGTPWLMWNDRQAILFHLVERKFYIFGLVFWPQDVIYLAILLIISAYALFLVTAVAGRLFCGYACPQTVYTQLFMWIENWIEGDRNARRYWADAGHTPHKIIQTSSMEALREMVALNLGVTILSDMVFRPWSLDGRRIHAVPMDARLPVMEVGLAWSAGRALSPCAAALEQFLGRSFANGAQATART
jgi:hypothetical protein